MEEPCDDLPIDLVQARERAFEMLLDDPARTTQLGQRRRVEDERPPPALHLPEPLHHQLQVRRLDTATATSAGDDTAAGEPSFDPTGRDLVDDRRDQGRLDDDLRPADRLQLGQRFDDRRMRAVDVEVVEPEHVARTAPGRVP